MNDFSNYQRTLDGLEGWWRNKTFTTTKGDTVADYKTLLRICNNDLELALEEVSLARQRNEITEKAAGEWSAYLTNWAKDLERRGQIIKGLAKVSKRLQEITPSPKEVFSQMNPLTMVRNVLLIGGVVVVVALLVLPKVLKPVAKVAGKLL